MEGEGLVVVLFRVGNHLDKNGTVQCQLVVEEYILPAGKERARASQVDLVS